MKKNDVLEIYMEDFQYSIPNNLKVICTREDYWYNRQREKKIIKKNDYFLAVPCRSQDDNLFHLFTVDGIYMCVFARNNFEYLAEFRDRRIKEIFDEK